MAFYWSTCTLLFVQLSDQVFYGEPCAGCSKWLSILRFTSLSSFCFYFLISIFLSPRSSCTAERMHTADVKHKDHLPFAHTHTHTLYTQKKVLPVGAERPLLCTEIDLQAALRCVLWVMLFGSTCPVSVSCPPPSLSSSPLCQPLEWEQ